MINLLPPKQKEEMKNQEKLKILIHFEILIFSFFICLALIFLAINFLLEGELKAQKIIFETQVKNLDLATEKEISQKNKILKEIFEFEKKRKDFFPQLKRIFEKIPKTIELKSISLEKIKLKKEKREEIVANLNCFAKKREDIEKFREILRKEFENVVFPPEIWFKEKEIDFSVTFKIK